MIANSSAQYRIVGFSKNDLLRETGIDLDLFAKNPAVEILTVKRTNDLQHHRWRFEDAQVRSHSFNEFRRQGTCKECV